MPRLPLLALCLAACSPEGNATPPASEEAVAATPAKAAPALAKPAAEGSRVIGKKDFALRGKPACEVDFVYAGRAPENLFWEEPCDAVTAKLMDRKELEALGRWGRLDDYAQKFVAALPGGRVLYVEGSFSASVYPVGTTGDTYEVPVAD